MPRKLWIQKNLYCHRSKLSRDDFEMLVFAYFLEIISCYMLPSPRENVLAELNKKMSVTISRQTFISYYRKISCWLWEEWCLAPKEVAKSQKKMTKEQGLIVVEKLYKFILILNSKEKFDVQVAAGLKGNVNFSEEFLPLTRNVMFGLLLQRNKLMKGISKKTLYLEYARIMFLFDTIEPLLAENNEIFYREDLHQDLTVSVTKRILKMLEKKPI